MRGSCVSSCRDWRTTFCFHVKWDEEFGQTIIAAMGEVELDAIIDRVRREFNQEVNVGAPQVAYRETITRSHQQDYTHKKLFAGTGQFARVKIMFEPNAYNPDLVFASRIVGGAIPNDYVAGVEKGLRSILSAGAVRRLPDDRRQGDAGGRCLARDRLLGLAFEVAGRACFREAAPRLGVQLLEPIMKVEVVTPADYAGSITGELRGLRGRIEDQEARDSTVVVNAMVPLATCSNWSSALLVAFERAGALERQLRRIRSRSDCLTILTRRPLQPRSPDVRSPPL